jgi:hypothetical protein
MFSLPDLFAGARKIKPLLPWLTEHLALEAGLIAAP